MNRYKLFLLFIILANQSFGQGLIFKTELDFLKSDYSTCALLKYYRSVSKLYEKVEFEGCDKLKPVTAYNTQQILYSKYESLIDNMKDNSHCVLPAYFHKKTNGTYTFLFNFLDFGITLPESTSPQAAFFSMFKITEPILYAISTLTSAISKGEISTIGMSICYKEKGDYINAPNILAFWVGKKDIDDYRAGSITKDVFCSKFAIYHTSKSTFIKIQ